MHNYFCQTSADVAVFQQIMFEEIAEFLQEEVREICGSRCITDRPRLAARRTHYEDEDITSINDRNAVFNKKLERAFGEYTLEMRQNLERGTAL
jgi:hypothetical protein